MSGARALSEAGRPHASLALIGEPTGLTPVRMHKGIMMEGIRLVGRAGHSSNPSLGNNAIDGMHRVISELMTWRQELESRWNNPAFEVPGPTLNLGHIHGGDNPNRICGECELRIDLRPLPGMDLEALHDELRERLATRLADSGLRLEVESLFPALPGMETAPDSPMVQLARPPSLSAPRGRSCSSSGWTPSSSGRAESTRPTSPTSTSNWPRFVTEPS